MRKWIFAAMSIERVVRDAILGCYARDLVEAPDEEFRTEIWRKVRWANNWLVANGYAPQDLDGLGDDEEGGKERNPTAVTARREVSIIADETEKLIASKKEGTDK